MVVLLFTAISYGKMVKVFPEAGSAYSYARKAIHPVVGFLVGWSALLDYLLLPLVDVVIVRIYFHTFFPTVPVWIWVVAFTILITGFNIRSMNASAKLNMTMLVIGLIGITLMAVLAYIYTINGAGNETIFSLAPLWHSNVEISNVLTGTTVVAFSFLGFDAITMYVEEAKNAKIVPRAIILCVLLGGLIFLVASWIVQSAFPTLNAFQEIDDTAPELALFVGGKLFAGIYLATALAQSLSASIAAQSSVSRLLYVMGRNGMLAPKRLFGYVHPRFRTPVFTTLLTAAVCLLAIGPKLEFVASMINFGALIAFTSVNLSVIAYFAIRKRKFRSPHDVLHYLILPTLGAAGTAILWSRLHIDALVVGLVWFSIGLLYLAILTSVLRRPVSTLGLD